jgi:hypothetical protein
VSRDPLGNPHGNGGWEYRHGQMSAFPGSRPQPDRFSARSQPAPWISPPPWEAATAPFPLATGAPGAARMPSSTAWPGTARPGTVRPGTVRPGTGWPGTAWPRSAWGGDEVPGFEFDRRSRQGRHRAGGRGGGGHARPARRADPGLAGYLPLTREPAVSMLPTWSETDTVPGFDLSVGRYSPPRTRVSGSGARTRAPAPAAVKQNLAAEEPQRICVCGWTLLLMMVAILIASGIAAASLLTLTGRPRPRASLAATRRRSRRTRMPAGPSRFPGP